MKVTECKNFLQNTLNSFSGLKTLVVKRLVSNDTANDLIQGSDRMIQIYGYEGYVSELFSELYKSCKNAIKGIEKYTFDWDNLM